MDYIILLRSGRTIIIEGVTATPTLVTNDGTSYKVHSEPYRDIYPITEASGAAGSVNAGFRTIPTFTNVTSGPVLGMTVTDYEVVSDDITRTTPLPPKQADQEWSHWKFVTTGSMAFFIPFENVEAMGTKLP